MDECIANHVSNPSVHPVCPSVRPSARPSACVLIGSRQVPLTCETKPMLSGPPQANCQNNNGNYRASALGLKSELLPPDVARLEIGRAHV